MFFPLSRSTLHAPRSFLAPPRGEGFPLLALALALNPIHSYFLSCDFRLPGAGTVLSPFRPPFFLDFAFGPRGTRENSPPFQRRVRSKEIPSPAGTAELQFHIFFVCSARRAKASHVVHSVGNPDLCLRGKNLFLCF